MKTGMRRPVGLDVGRHGREEDALAVSVELTITIDGPAGTGKSSTARLLANRLGVEFLDTGAMYRAAALIAMEQGIDLEDGDAVAHAVSDAGLYFDWSTDPPLICARNPKPRNLTDLIRGDDVNAAVSIVAGHAPLRQVMVEQQRTIRREHPRLVTEGRDQGSVVFPMAEVKFYLDADPRVRAARRVKQVRKKGGTADPDAVLAEILRRDAYDKARTDGPLIVPDDAIVVETSNITRDEVVDTLERLVRERIESLRQG